MMDERWIPCEEDASGHTYGREELALIEQVLKSGVLLANPSGPTAELEREFAARYGATDAIACSSATTGLQGALAATGLPTGSEVITTPLTDIGGLSAILQQGHVPVFADVDPVTGNLDPNSVARAVSPNTSALVVTHLVGNPADMDSLTAVAQEHNMVLIEDCAQAYDAKYGGRPVGTFGQVGVFSTQQSKHISSGEGGLLLTSDPGTALALRVWINKGVAGGVRARDEDHPVVGVNGRMSELQGAVALAQLRKLTDNVATRIALADELTDLLSSLPGVSGPATPAGAVQTYWKYLISVDPDQRPGLRDKLAEALEQRRAIVAPCYLHLPLFAKTLFLTHPRRLVGESEVSHFEPGRDDSLLFPGMRSFISSAIVMWWNERLMHEHVVRVFDLIKGIASK